MRREVVEASHIAGEGLLDAFGHVSARSPDRPDRFFMLHSLAPALVADVDGLTPASGSFYPSLAFWKHERA